MNTVQLAFFFLFTIFTTLPSAIAEVVLDTDGQPLLNNGGPYFILSYRHRGFKLAKTKDDGCPISVVRAATDYFNGLALRLSFPCQISTISTKFRLNIQFVAITPSYWQIADDSSVKIGERKRFVGPFQIEKFNEDEDKDLDLYKILYCEDQSDDSSEPLRISFRSDESRVSVGDGDLLLVKFHMAL